MKEFKFKESAIDLNNSKEIKRTKFIVIDAIAKINKNEIIDEENIFRDIHKAYVGFNLSNFKEQKINE